MPPPRPPPPGERPPGPLRISADLAWREAVAGDPVRLWTRLHGPTDLVAPNWTDGLLLSLYRVGPSGQRSLVLGPDRWPPFMQPLWFDSTLLAIPNATRMREWLAPAEDAGLTAGTYLLEIAWNGGSLAPSSILPSHGILTARPIQFEVKPANTTARQAVRERHLAWASYLADDMPGAFRHAQQAAAMDPDSEDPLALTTGFIQVTAAIRQLDYSAAAQTLGRLSQLLPEDGELGELVHQQAEVFMPRLFLLGAAWEGQPVRLEIQGLPGATYVLQGSTDVENWTVLGAHHLTTSRLEMSVEPPPGTSRQFFRATWSQAR